jgi:hypothetical protein
MMSPLWNEQDSRWHCAVILRLADLHIAIYIWLIRPISGLLCSTRGIFDRYLASCVLHVAYYDQYLDYYVLHVAYYDRYLARCVLHVAYYDEYLAYYVLHVAYYANIWPVMFYTWHIMTNTWPIIFHIRLTVITYDFLCLQLPIPTLLLPTRCALWPISSFLWPISSLLWPTYGVTVSICPIMVLPVPASKDGRVENVVNWSRIFREGLKKTVTSSEYSAVTCNPIWDCCDQITPIVCISVTLSICFSRCSLLFRILFLIRILAELPATLSEATWFSSAPPAKCCNRTRDKSSPHVLRCPQTSEHFLTVWRLNVRRVLYTAVYSSWPSTRARGIWNWE